MRRYGLDVKVAILGAIGGLALFGIAIVIRKGIGISLSLLLPCIGYLVIEWLEGREGIRHLEREVRVDQRLRSIGPLLILPLIVFLAFSLHAFLYLRPPEYFILACTFSALIGLEIYMLPQNRWFAPSILLQTLLLATSLQWGVIFEYNSLVGGDLYHSLLTSYIIQNGHIIPNTYVISWAAEAVSESIRVYHDFPLMHIMVSEYSLVTSISSYKDSLTMSIGFLLIIGLLFIFVMSRKMFADQRIALLATLLLAVSAPYIFWGTQLVPQSFGVGLFIILVYLILKAQKENSRPALALFVLVLAAMMFAHTVSAFILLLTIFLLSISVLFTSRLIPRSSPDYRSIGIPMILLSSTAVLAYWMLFSNFLTERVDSLLRSFWSAHLLTLSPIGKTYFAYEVDNIGLYLFYAFGIIGLLASMRKSKLGPTRLGLSAMALLFLTYAFWLTSFTTFLPDRWIVFAFILLTIPAASGLAQIVALVRGQWRFILLFALLCSFTFFMVMNSDVNMDAPLIGTSQTIEYAYRDSEIVGASWAVSSSKTTVYSHMSDYFVDVLRARMSTIDFENFQAPQNSTLLISNRVYERPTDIPFAGRAIMVGRGFAERLASFDRVYSNGEVVAYYTEEPGK
jgi:hypothetical protein